MLAALTGGWFFRVTRQVTVSQLPDPVFTVGNEYRILTGDECMEMINDYRALGWHRTGFEALPGGGCVLDLWHGLVTKVVLRFEPTELSPREHGRK